MSEREERLVAWLVVILAGIRLRDPRLLAALRAGVERKRERQLVVLPKCMLAGSLDYNTAHVLVSSWACKCGASSESPECRWKEGT